MCIYCIIRLIVCTHRVGSVVLFAVDLVAFHPSSDLNDCVLGRGSTARLTCAHLPLLCVPIYSGKRSKKKRSNKKKKGTNYEFFASLRTIIIS